MAINPENLKKIQAAVASSLNEQWGLFLSEGIVLVIFKRGAPTKILWAKIPKYSVACR